MSGNRWAATDGTTEAGGGYATISADSELGQELVEAGARVKEKGQILINDPGTANVSYNGTAIPGEEVGANENWRDANVPDSKGGGQIDVWWNEPAPEEMPPRTGSSEGPPVDGPAPEPEPEPEEPVCTPRRDRRRVTLTLDPTLVKSPGFTRALVNTSGSLRSDITVETSWGFTATAVRGEDGYYVMIPVPTGLMGPATVTASARLSQSDAAVTAMAPAPSGPPRSFWFWGPAVRRKTRSVLIAAVVVDRSILAVSR